MSTQESINIKYLTEKLEQFIKDESNTKITSPNHFYICCQNIFGALRVDYANNHTIQFTTDYLVVKRYQICVTIDVSRRSIIIGIIDCSEIPLNTYENNDQRRTLYCSHSGVPNMFKDFSITITAMVIFLSCIDNDVREYRTSKGAEIVDEFVIKTKKRINENK